MKNKKEIIIVLIVFFLSSFFLGQRTCEAEAGKGFPSLVDTKWMTENLNNAGIRILFVDDWPSKKAEYDSKHIPGSAYLNIGAVMSIIGDGSIAPNMSIFESLMSNLGINKNDHVVLYGYEGKTIFTLGSLWLMEYFGHKKLSYMNGGLIKWYAENRKTSGEARQIKPTSYKAESPDESMRVDAYYVLMRLSDPNVLIIDARGTDEYTGQSNQETNRRVGHIPGAIDLGYYSTNFNTDGTIKSIEDLEDIYKEKGISKDKEIIVYCQGGLKTSNTFFVLKHILNFPTVKNYIGSWGEWGNRVNFNWYPVEQ